MGFIQQLGAEAASRLMRRWMPTGEEQYEQYKSKLATAKAEAEMKGLQSLDKPIYERPAEYDYSDEFAATGVAPGKLVSEEYKSPITNRMMRDWNLRPEELPRRDVEALGLRPQYRREPKPSYDWFQTEGGEIIPVQKDTIPPANAKPYSRPLVNISNPFSLMGQKTEGEMPPQEETPMPAVGTLPGQIEQGESTIKTYRKEDGKIVDIPASLEEAFLRDHPNAVRIK